MNTVIETRETKRLLWYEHRAKMGDTQWQETDKELNLPRKEERAYQVRNME